MPPAPRAQDAAGRAGVTFRVVAISRTVRRSRQGCCTRPSRGHWSVILGTMLSLRIRLAIAVALTVAVTVGGAGWLALRVSGETLTGASLRLAGFFALLAIVALVVLVDRVVRLLVGVPIDELRRTIGRVTAGDLSARAVVRTPNEIGEVAGGLNLMLERMEHLNDSLQVRVDDTARAIESQNGQLIDSYRRVFGLREQLARAEQLAAVGQTAANVAHQVGTPLNLISGYVQMLKEDVGLDSPLVARLAIIEEQVNKVAATVRTLLDRSRRMGPKSRTSVRAILARVIEAMQPKLEAARVRVELDVPAVVTEIMADVTSLELAVLHVMTNAVDAMPDGGTLTVRIVEARPDLLRLEVTDSGLGISDDLLPRIFDAWVSTKPPGHGAGLGLAITRVSSKGMAAPSASGAAGAAARRSPSIFPRLSVRSHRGRQGGQGRGPRAGRDRGAHGVPLARQRPRAREHHRAARRLQPLVPSRGIRAPGGPRRVAAICRVPLVRRPAHAR